MNVLQHDTKSTWELQQPPSWNYRIVSMQEIEMGANSFCVIMLMFFAVIVSRVQLSHKPYNNGDGLIKLPYNCFFSRLSNYCLALSVSNDTQNISTTNYRKSRFSSSRVDLSSIILHFKSFLFKISIIFRK